MFAALLRVPTGRRWYRAVAGWLLVLACHGALAAEPPAWIAAALPSARLAGAGAFTWFGLSIYEAQLWVGERGYQPGQDDSADRTDAAPFVLDLRYARSLNGRKIAEASAEQMEKVGAGSDAERQAWLQTMRGIFPDVSEGTHLAGLYLPGGGVRFYLDGKVLAEVADPAFARAFFAIWLSPRTSARKLRTALLTDAAPRHP
jgi:hypothetical protein